MRRYLLKRMTYIILTLLASCPGCNRKGLVQDQPNILFIMADDLGYGELGCYGCKDIRTPVLDKLAKEGIRFTDFYANAPVCSPTRLAFLTGRYQQRFGMDDALYYQEMGRGIPGDVKTIAGELAGNGYATGLFGKWHVGYDMDRRPLQQGFENFFGILGGNHHLFKHFDKIGVYDFWSGNDTITREGYTTELITEEAIAFIRENQKNPFFLYLSHLAPHFPYIGSTDEQKDVRPKHKSWMEGDSGTYAAMVEHMDSEIGRVLNLLDELGLRDQTLVVFTSDNGGAEYAPYSRNDPFRGFKSSIWEGGIRVPCIVRWPGALSAGEVTGQVGITMDWTTTFSRLTGLKFFTEVQDGIDLLPILKGEKPIEQRNLFWRVKSGPVRKVPEAYRAVRHQHWKLIEQYEGERWLFDLEKDPGESLNLASDHPMLTDQLIQKLDDWESLMEVK